MENETLARLKDGHYKSKLTRVYTYLFEAESMTRVHVAAKPEDKADPIKAGTCKYGELGDTHPEVAKITGQKKNNLEMSFMEGKWKIAGVVSDDGKTFTYWAMINKIDVWEWLTEEEYLAWKDSGDPVDAPTCHYKIQPEKVGKLLFISGGPGMGKSTTGQLLSKVAGYVYYEADCFMNHVNPFIPPEAEEPSMAQMGQFPLIPLKGVPQDRIDAATDCMKDFMQLLEGKQYDTKKVEKFYSFMCQDIAAQRRRIGGDWVVAHAVPTRAIRDHIRAGLGPDLIFVVLNMTHEDQLKRVKARHGDTGVGARFVELATKSYTIYEPADDDEENAINVMITKDMSREDVVEKILKEVENY